MRIQTIPATSYLYSLTRTSFEDIAIPATQAISKLRHLTTIGEAPTHPVRCFLSITIRRKIYPTPFDLEIGLPLRDSPAAATGWISPANPAGISLRSVIYRGPMKLLPKAYARLIPEMIAAGLVPSVETRESYVVWESPDSPKNVVQIEVGIR